MTANNTSCGLLKLINFTTNYNCITNYEKQNNLPFLKSSKESEVWFLKEKVHTTCKTQACSSLKWCESIGIAKSLPSLLMRNLKSWFVKLLIHALAELRSKELSPSPPGLLIIRNSARLGVLRRSDWESLDNWCLMQNWLCFPCKGTPAPLRITLDQTWDNQFDKVHKPNVCLLSALCTVKGYFHERSHWLTSLNSQCREARFKYLNSDCNYGRDVNVNLLIKHLTAYQSSSSVLGAEFCFTGRTNCRLHSWQSREDRGTANHLVCFTETRYQKERALS